MTDEPTWQQTLADALIDAGVEVAAWVPDKRLAPIGARLVERGIPLRTLTREEECFGYAAGFRAAGGMPLVLVQCSGLGNSLNAIGSLVIPYGLGVPGRALDAGDARRAQPGADAARPDDGGDARRCSACRRSRCATRRDAAQVARARSPSPRARGCSRRSSSKPNWSSA